MVKPSISEVCVVPSGGDVGDPCDREEDCMSGVCYTDICLQSCRSNGDCPTGQLCSPAPRAAGCVLVSDCPGCDAPDSVCNIRGCMTACLTSAECPDICELNMIDQVGYCEDSHWLDCTGDEVDLRGFGMPPTTGGYCFIYTACWQDADCPNDYLCVYDVVSSDANDAAGFCARFVPDQLP